MLVVTCWALALAASWLSASASVMPTFAWPSVSTIRRFNASGRPWAISTSRPFNHPPDRLVEPPEWMRPSTFAAAAAS